MRKKMNLSQYCGMALLSLGLAGCSALKQNLLEGPELSAVGSGLTQETAVDITESTSEAQSLSSDWIGGPTDYFRDSRARRVGDLISVRIGINDNANINSSSDRSRRASANGTATFNVGAFGFIGDGAGSGNASNDSASSGKGTVSRSEKLNLALTVIVRKVYANGNMLVEGSQEVLVNFEKRVVHVSGIVDPRFIAADNSVDYSKIAEARVSYGGSGKISDTQKPRWGMQLWDKISPF
jgi:flagellar L-ring protein FlgH